MGRKLFLIIVLPSLFLVHAFLYLFSKITLNIYLVATRDTSLIVLEDNSTCNLPMYRNLKQLLDPKRAHDHMPAFKRMNDSTMLRDHCNTCAVVSSSGILLLFEAGGEINSHDCVFRMNHHETRGFEAHVGNKTTYRILGFTTTNKISKIRDFEFDTPQQVKYIIWIPERPRKLSYFWYFADKLRHNFPHRIQVYMGDDTHFNDIWKEETRQSVPGNMWLSTGFFTIVTALNVCDNVTLFGFVSKKSCKDNPSFKYKYAYSQPKERPHACSIFEGQVRKSRKYHKMHNEHEIFHRWSKYRNITFVAPKWD